MNMTVRERTILLESILEELSNDSLTIGEAVRRLRVEVTGLHQSQFAKMCKISVRTLLQMEHGEGNQTLKSLNAVFTLFGMKMGVVKRQSLHVSAVRASSGLAT
jgi:transcriptional regulator with XRE-family HTH domain